jgi:hypothetical protein
MVFLFFFENNPVPSVRARSRRQRYFFIFLKNFFAEGFWQLLSAKLGTPELGKFFPELPSRE